MWGSLVRFVCSMPMRNRVCRLSLSMCGSKCCTSTCALTLPIPSLSASLSANFHLMRRERTRPCPEIHKLYPLPERGAPYVLFLLVFPRAFWDWAEEFVRPRATHNLGMALAHHSAEVRPVVFQNRALKHFRAFPINTHKAIALPNPRV